MTPLTLILIVVGSLFMLTPRSTSRTKQFAAYLKIRDVLPPATQTQLDKYVLPVLVRCSGDNRNTNKRKQPTDPAKTRAKRHR